MNREILNWLVLLGVTVIFAYFGYNWLHFKQPYVFLAMIFLIPILILVVLRMIQRG